MGSLPAPKTHRADVTTITAYIDRILDTGWIELDDLEKFVTEAKRMEVAGTVRVWWTQSPDDQPPRLEISKSVKRPSEPVEETP